MFNDLREYIETVKERGELKEIEGADWDLEIGAITEIIAERRGPALLFDKVKGYPTGYRVVSNLFTTEKRTALALELPLELKGIELVKAWRDKIRELKPIPPVEVKSGPIKENIHLGDEVDLFEFPTPKWRELDGGRFIGTGVCVIMRDPDEGWVNVGTYRVQVQSKSTVTILIGPGHHGRIIRDKYWAKGLECPVAMTCGQDPALFTFSQYDVPWGVSELDYAGWLRKKAVEVINGETTDLPIPATSEIAIEGFIPPPGHKKFETRPEGPFGEWSGYYGKPPTSEPVMRITSILHRDNPILQGNPPLKPPTPYGLGDHITKAALIWDEVERQVPDVKGVWIMPEAATTNAVIIVVSIKQRYGGHAKQAALVASACRAGAMYNRFTIAVDDDINPSNLNDVLWALGSRCDPETSIDIIRRGWVLYADPLQSPEKRTRGDLTNTRAVIIACKPFEWIDKFPPVNKSSPRLRKKVMKKWEMYIK